MKPLEGILVLDFSQYLAGPSAALRLADLGARVIKVENPTTGDNARHLTLKNMTADGDSVNFYAINRNKESFAANLKDPTDFRRVSRLVEQADVIIENFRPGVMDKLGLGYGAVSARNPRLVYASITGYGTEGPWRGKPGQDLLVQSLSGLAYLNGNADQPPTPFGVSIADSYTGTHVVDGILACLVRRGKTGRGGRVEVSLLESILSLQFETITTYLNDGHQPPRRSSLNNAHAYLSAPYGIYATADGFVALAMGSVTELGKILTCPALEAYTDAADWFDKRDEIKAILQGHLQSHTTAQALGKLEGAGYWAAPVLNWAQLYEEEGFRQLDFVQSVQRPGQPELLTTRCPIRYNGQPLCSAKWAPCLGEDNGRVIADFHLDEGEGDL